MDSLLPNKLNFKRVDWYCLAGIGLLILAAGLRLYSLSADPLWHDELVVALNSRGSLSEVLANTRQNNSSPILYPLALYAIQKVESSAFSVRLLPAAASVLTVAVLLFLLPRLGVGRGTALLAALLLTLSAAAIEQAQDAREYSVDALLAALLIAGLLWYRREGRKALLCGVLFLAPLTQYGLAIFGAATLAAALLLSPHRNSAEERQRPPGSLIPGWRHGRLGLAWPLTCFLAGCLLTYLVTASHQWRNLCGGDRCAGGYLSEYYYSGRDLVAFTASGLWEVLQQHLPGLFAGLAAGVFLIFLARSLQSRSWNAIALLTLFALLLAWAAGVAAIYPFGSVRHSLYLGPIICLAAGWSFHSAAGGLAGRAGRDWLRPALLGGLLGGIALAGTAQLVQADPYRTLPKVEAALAILEDRAQAEDMVFLESVAAQGALFSLAAKPQNYHYGEVGCFVNFAKCIPDLSRATMFHPNLIKRIWLVHLRDVAVAGELRAAWDEDLVMETVAVEGIYRITLVTNLNPQRVQTYQEMVSGKPAARGYFEVYRRGNENLLLYFKSPCAPTDTESMFFLHLYPQDPADLPATRQRSGFNVYDFPFAPYGRKVGADCMVPVWLPDYPLQRIHTGQFDLSSREWLWEVEFPGEQ